MKKFISRICCDSVLSKQTATFFRGPYPKSLAQSRFRLGIGRRGHRPYRFDILATQKNSSEAYALTTLAPHVQNAHRTPGGYVRGAPLTRVFFGFRRSRNSVSFDACQRNEQKTFYNQNTLFALPKLFSKNPTFFQKPLDKSSFIVYNIPRYPKTAGFRKSVPLSCRGRRQFNPHGCTTVFLRAELWH